MSREHRRDVITLFVIAGAALLLIVALIGRGSRFERDPLVAIPTDSFIVVTLDVRALAESPVGAALAGNDGALAGSFFGVDSLQATCGFDPLSHMQAIAIAVPEGDTHGELGIAATGDLSKSALATCAKALITKRGGSWSTRESGSFSIVTENRTHGAEVAFREGGPFLVGRGEWLEKMIDATEGRTRSMAQAASDLHHTLRADLAALDKGANAAVVSVVLPSELRARIGHEFTADHDAGEPPLEKPSAMDGVLAVGGVGLAIHAGKGHEETRIVAELRCDGDAADEGCARVETLLLHERLKWSGDLRFRLFGLGPLIDAIQTELREHALIVRTRGPSDAIAHMITRAVEGRSGAHASDAPHERPPAPSPARRPDDVVRAAPSGSAR